MTSKECRQAGYGYVGGIDKNWVPAVLFHFAHRFHFPNDSITTAIVSNGIEFSNRELLKGVLSHACGKDYELPRFSYIGIPRQKHDRYLGWYVEVSDSIPGYSHLKIEYSVRFKAIYEFDPHEFDHSMKPISETRFRYGVNSYNEYHYARFRELRDGKYQKLILKKNGKEIEFERDDSIGERD